MSSNSARLREINGPLKAGQYVFSDDGVSIPFRYKAGRMKALVIIFHGALNREKRDHPFFQPFLPIDVNQISISDPTLAADPELGAAWYIGGENWNLPDKLSGLIAQVARSLGAPRRVYVGASVGGYAALFYSSRDEGSVAVAANPQTHLLNYQNAQFQRLRQVCWPSCDTVEKFEQKAPISVSAIYAKPVTNRVIYLQSAGDYGHIKTQFLHFTSKLNPSNVSNLILDVGFWNILGHSGSVPPSAWVPWVRAVLTSKTINADDLLVARHALREARVDSARPVDRSLSFDAQDLERAALIRGHLLQM
ncbi:hypothetical protein [Erythrobacter ani]|uniref:Alpha/beta hydrolase n=1 Tax=Erythrobacter ani TaxID=2827235 RepID=A0ABS6SJ98_9SPHN|nr:hypothetical protein [Erythrobacter ani]MBV7265083.1 hypothetical protein [Erythrobacter ani]